MTEHDEAILKAAETPTKLKTKTAPKKTPTGRVPRPPEQQNLRPPVKTEEDAPPRRILRTLPVIRDGLDGTPRIIGYQRDPSSALELARAHFRNVRFCDWCPVWLRLPDGRRFITEAWVLS